MFVENNNSKYTNMVDTKIQFLQATLGNIKKNVSII